MEENQMTVKKRNYAIEIAERTGVSLTDVRKVLAVLKDSKKKVFDDLIKDVDGYYLKGVNPPVRGFINNIDRLDFNLSRLIEARLRNEVEPAKFDDMINSISELVGNTKKTLAQKINSLAYEKKNKDQEFRQKVAAEAKKKVSSNKDESDDTKQAS